MGIEAWTVNGDFVRLHGVEALPDGMALPSRCSHRDGVVLIPISAGEVSYPNQEGWTEAAAEANDIAALFRFARDARLNVELIRGCRMFGEGMTGMEFNQYFTRQPLTLSDEQIEGLLGTLDDGEALPAMITELVGDAPPILAGASGDVR
ncbi:MAG: hypothetical protein KDD42_10200 [Bdellovibrionales bacterium]|nr:hypothetical protein [Bdellovibrionales bacterium]